MDVLNFQKPAAYRNTHTSQMMENDYMVEGMTVKFDEIDIGEEMDESDESNDQAEDTHPCTLL